MLPHDLAAAYAGVSIDTFDWEVSHGLMPGPLMRGRKGGKPTWDRFAIDDALDARTGRGQVDGKREDWLGRLDDSDAA